MFTWTKEEKLVLPIALAIIVVISIITCFLTRKQNETVRKIPLMIISATMLILEVAKQVINIQSGYSYWAIPLHFCSLFLYFFPLVSFFKGRVGDFGKVMSLVCSTYFIVLFYFNPSSVIGNSSANIFQSFGTFHTWFYHHLVILFFFIFVGSKLYKPKKVDFLYATLGILLYGAIAVPVAHALDTNFCNLLHSNIPFMETLRINTSQAFYTFIMFVVGIGGVNIVIFIAHLIQYIIDKHKAVNTPYSKIMKILKTDI